MLSATGAPQNVVGVHIVSFNVAGWAKTHARITELFGSLDQWLELMQCDVLALQEVKMGDAHQLRLVAPPTSQWDAFFAVADPKPQWQGVAVYVRKGAGLVRSVLKTLGPFTNLGRYIEASLRGFTLINVYVHNDGEGARHLNDKMCFLMALRRRVLELRAHGPVVLCGDLNLKSRAADTTPEHRFVNLRLLRDSPASPGVDTPLAVRVRAALNEPQGLERLCQLVGSVQVTASGRMLRFLLREQVVWRETLRAAATVEDVDCARSRLQLAGWRVKASLDQIDDESRQGLRCSLWSLFVAHRELRLARVWGADAGWRVGVCGAANDHL